MIFTNIDQGLLLFYIAAGLAAIAGALLLIASKK